MTPSQPASQPASQPTNVDPEDELAQEKKTSKFKKCINWGLGITGTIAAVCTLPIFAKWIQWKHEMSKCKKDLCLNVFFDKDLKCYCDSNKIALSKIPETRVALRYLFQTFYKLHEKKSSLYEKILITDIAYFSRMMVEEFYNPSWSPEFDKHFADILKILNRLNTNYATNDTKKALEELGINLSSPLADKPLLKMPVKKSSFRFYL